MSFSGLSKWKYYNEAPDRARSREFGERKYRIYTHIVIYSYIKNASCDNESKVSGKRLEQNSTLIDFDVCN